MTDSNEKNQEKEIIELSEIAVGTSAEDNEIIELTEDLVDEARDAISGATQEKPDESRELELSRDLLSEPESFTNQEQETAEKADLISESQDLDIPEKQPDSDIEQDIARELDNYFPLDEEPSGDIAGSGETGSEKGPEPDVDITDQQLQDALERVIERKYGRRIEEMISEIVRLKISEDIENIKDYILKRHAGR